MRPGADRPDQHRSAGGVDPEAAARQICLRLLAAQPRTRAQLRAALRRGGVPDEVAEAVLGRFAEAGLIDDAAFAQAWVETRHHSRGLAGRALAAELRHRGVAAGEVRSAVGSLGAEQEVMTARRLVARRMASSRGRPLPTRVRQLVSMLNRRGYPPALAYRVVREALEQESQADLETALGVDASGLDDAFDVSTGSDLDAILESGAGDEWRDA